MVADDMRRMFTGTPAALTRLAGACALSVLLAGCQPDSLGYGPKHLQPLAYAIKAEMKSKDMTPGDPVLVRLFKEESELEVWKRTSNGKFALLKSYPICKWSGKLGPKFKEGDRQAPEGFYTIRPGQMNPNSSYHLSFNLGYPNAYDRAYGRTGQHLMVHGACSSRGCYAMEDEQIQEIYSLARESFRGGQRDFQVEAYPFRMTPENMARHADNEFMPFWRMLKEGYDHFEVTRLVPKVDVCGKRYVFDAQLENGSDKFIADKECPAYQVPAPIQQAVAAKQRRDDEKMTVLVAQAEAKRAREEAWKNGETPLAKIFGGGTDGETQQAAAPEEAAPGDDAAALAYAGAPVPERNPTKPFTAKETGGLFGGLFKRDKAPDVADEQRQPEPQTASPTTPLILPPVPQAPPASAPDVASGGTGAAAAAEIMQPEADPITTQSLPKPKEDKSGIAKVSDVVSRWFGGSKAGN